MGVDTNISQRRKRASAMARSFRNDESGATAIEYGLLVALLFLAIVAGVKGYTQSASGMYDRIDNTLQNG